MNHVTSKKSLPKPVFFSRSFTVLGLTYSFVLHVELILINDVKCRLRTYLHDLGTVNPDTCCMGQNVVCAAKCSTCTSKQCVCLIVG